MDSMKKNIDQAAKGVLIFVSAFAALFVIGFFLWAAGHSRYKVKYLTGEKSGTVAFVAEQGGYESGDTVTHDGVKIVIIEKTSNSK